MGQKLVDIKNTNIMLLEEMHNNCKYYFEQYIRNYFKDPTFCFINWLIQNSY